MFAACSRAPVCNFPMPYWDTAGSITVREGQQITQYILNIGIPRRPGKFPASCRGERAPPYLLLISSRGKLPWRMPSLCASPLCSSPLTHSRAHNNQRRSASSSLDRRRFLSPPPPSQIDIVGATFCLYSSICLRWNVTYTRLLSDGGWLCFVCSLYKYSFLFRSASALLVPSAHTAPSYLYETLLSLPFVRGLTSERVPRVSRVF